MIIMEYEKYQTLEKVINKDQTKLDNTDKSIIIYGLANLILYLHSKDFVFINFEMRNILVDCKFQPKIINFNTIINTKFINTNTEKSSYEKNLIKSNFRFIAPEIFRKKEYQKSSDIYSFSIFIYQLLTNEEAYSTIYDIYELIETIERNEFGRFNQLFSKLTTTYQRLISTCLNPNIDQRFTITEIIELLQSEEYINENDIDKTRYYEYIQYLNEFPISFDESKQILQFIYDYNDQFSKYFNNPIDLSHLKNLENFEKKEKIDQKDETEWFKLIEKNTEKEYIGIEFLNELNKNEFESIIKLSLEINKLCKLECPSLIKYIGYSPTNFEREFRPIIITEYAENSLKYLIQLSRENKAPRCWNITKKLIILYGIATSMAYLHSHNIVNNSLYPSNILLDQYLLPKIAIIGSKCVKKENVTNFIKQNNENFVYLSPEYFIDMKATKETDVYSFSIIIYELFSNKKAYENFTFQTILDLFIGGNRPKLDVDIPNVIVDLINYCWNQDPEERPTFDDIVKCFKECIDTFISIDGVIKEDLLSYIKFIDNYFHDKKIEDFINLKSDTYQKVRISKESKRFNFNFVFVNLDQYEKKVKIGEGSFGVVYKVINKTDELFYAAKISKAEINSEIEDEMIQLSREVTIMSKLNHPSILKFIGYSPVNFKKKMHPVIITELLCEGTLEDLINLERKSLSKKGWDETKKLINIYGIASSMQYLHSHNILHRDLRPTNILVDYSLYPKLADFGLSKEISNNNKNSNFISGFKGTPAYIAPEIWTSHDYQKASDVYAFAFTMFEIITNQECFPDINNIFTFCNEVIFKNKRPEFDYPIRMCYKKMIEDCWSSDPKKRPTFDEIVYQLETNHDFITDNVDEDEYLNYIDYVSNNNNNLYITGTVQNEENKTHQNQCKLSKINQNQSENIKVVENKSENEVDENEVDENEGNDNNYK